MSINKNNSSSVDVILFWSNLIVGTIFLFFVPNSYYLGIPSSLYITVRCLLGGFLAWEKAASWESLIKFFYTLFGRYWPDITDILDTSDDFKDEERFFLGRILEVILGLVFLFRLISVAL